MCVLGDVSLLALGSDMLLVLISFKTGNISHKMH